MCYGILQSDLPALPGPFDIWPRYDRFEGERTTHPLTQAAFFRQQAGQQPELAQGQFGLVPAWVTDAKGGKSYGKNCYNARLETVFEKPSFRDPILRRRAVIPVQGYLEFADLGPDAGKNFRVRKKGGGQLYLAGLWDYSERYDALSCSIITSEPQDWIKETHSRSPVLLDGGQVLAWLDPALKERAGVAAFLQVYAGRDLYLEYFEAPKRPRAAGPVNGELDLGF
jgi:putative SOS response-associated peptidase YedK